MNEEKDKSSIDKLEKDLYSRNHEQVEEKERREFRERDFGVSKSWEAEPSEDDSQLEMKKRKSKLKVILIASIAFFAVSVVFSFYFFVKVPAVSPKNVTIEIQGPALIGGGEELGLQIAITNKNVVPIESVNLIVEYPDGTRAATNINTKLPRHTESLGVIDPGEQVNRTVRSVLFGEENSTKDIEVTVEYRVQNSNAIFFNDYVYQLALSSSPLSLVIESNKEAISGQEVEFTAIISSNSDNVVRNVLLEVEYPFGFDFESSEPKPLFAERVWNLGDIPPEGEKKITFRGTLVGQDGEERIFRFATGLESERDENIIGAAFINIAETLIIKRPFLTASLALGGNTTRDYVVRMGEVVRADISWTNNLATQIFDGEIEVKFDGAVLDKLSVRADEGFIDL